MRRLHLEIIVVKKNRINTLAGKVGTETTSGPAGLKRTTGPTEAEDVIRGDWSLVR